MADSDEFWGGHRYGVEFKIGAMPFRTGFLQTESGAEQLRDMIQSNFDGVRDVEVIDQVALIEGDA